MIGLLFKANHDVPRILATIEQNMEAQPWEWVVDLLWIQGPTENNFDHGRLDNKRISTQELLKAFQSLGHDFVFFGRFRRYPLGAEIKEIEVMQDFLDSECSLILCVIDGHYYEIYSKDRDELEKMYTSISQIEGTEDFTIDTLENYGRTSFIF